MAAVLRKAGEDPFIQALGLAALGVAAGVPGVASTADLLTGETHGLNSGEIPLNTLISLLPLATMGTGAGLAMLGPEARVTAELMAIQAQQQSLLDRSKNLAERETSGGLRGWSEEQKQAKINAMLEEHLRMKQRLDPAMGRARDMASQISERDVNVSAEDALRMVGRRGMRSLYGGALVGALVGTPWALQLMQDKEVQQ